MFTWKGAWAASTREVMRGMGLQPAEVRRVVAARSRTRVAPEGRTLSRLTLRVAPNPRTATARKPIKPVKSVK